MWVGKYGRVTLVSISHPFYLPFRVVTSLINISSEIHVLITSCHSSSSCARAKITASSNLLHGAGIPILVAVEGGGLLVREFSLQPRSLVINLEGSHDHVHQS